jgi:2-polyprenyl-3-methyl-5-hydroxy-6-metoxy-1,4-benzoquinol methylase
MLRWIGLVALIINACTFEQPQDRNISSWDTTRIEEPSVSRDLPLPGDRISWQNPDLVINKLGNLENKRIADIGAGTGYFTFRLAARGATVVAIDIERDYLSYIDNRKDQLPNLDPGQIITRLSKFDDPLLKRNEADIVLIVNTYTFLPDRVKYLTKVHTGIAENGMICIVDYKSREVPVISSETPVIDSETIKNELLNAGFSKIDIDNNSLEFQYIITAKK